MTNIGDSVPETTINVLAPQIAGLEAQFATRFEEMERRLMAVVATRKHDSHQKKCHYGANCTIAGCRYAHPPAHDASRRRKKHDLSFPPDSLEGVLFRIFSRGQQCVDQGENAAAIFTRILPDAIGLVETAVAARQSQYQMPTMISKQESWGYQPQWGPVPAHVDHVMRTEEHVAPQMYPRQPTWPQPSWPQESHPTWPQPSWPQQPARPQDPQPRILPQSPGTDAADIEAVNRVMQKAQPQVPAGKKNPDF